MDDTSTNEEKVMATYPVFNTETGEQKEVVMSVHDWDQWKTDNPQWTRDFSDPSTCPGVGEVGDGVKKELKWAFAPMVEIPEDERKKIFTVLLSQIRPESINDFNIEQLSKKSADFSGAEIYQAIIEGMHIAFNENREFTTNDILHGLTEIIPLAQLEGKKIQALQQWALSGRIRTASSNL